MFSPYRKFNSNALMEQNQDMQQYGITNQNQPNFNSNSEDIASVFGKLLSTDNGGSIMDNLKGKNGFGASGKMGGSKMGYANAITPWLNSDKSTGQKVGSSIGTAAGFYFGGPIGAQIVSWAGDKIGSWLGG